MGDRTHLYETVADRMQALIEEGTLRPGDRIPSVRHLHRQWSVSVTTVLEAYRLLEDRGWIDARPRSGYYVRPNPYAQVEEPEVSDPPARPQLETGAPVRPVRELTEKECIDRAISDILSYFYKMQILKELRD